MEVTYYCQKKKKNALLLAHPEAKPYIKKFVGALEFIRGVNKFCIWIEDNQLQNALTIPPLAERIKKTQEVRLISKRASTQLLSETPHKFAEIRYFPTDSIIIPSTSSENRYYIPIGFLNKDSIIPNSAMAIYYAQPWHFAVVTSRMHMVWVRAVGGKLETRYRYSAKLCYNTFPFPKIDKKQEELLTQYVFDILDAQDNGLDV